MDHRLIHPKNIHIGRDCEKSAVDSRYPEWMEIKGMISQAIGERNNLEKQGILSFEEEYIHNFECRMHENLDKLEIQNKRDESRFYADEERRLINRLRKYYDNTFAWMRDFSLPHSNNLSERALKWCQALEKYHE